MHPTFRERYCRSYGLANEEFEQHIFRRGLYPHAALLRWLLGAIPEYFAADREFIRSVGDIRSRRFFHAEAGEYQMHLANRGFLRRWLRLRVSAERVRRCMEQHWGDENSAAPVQAGDLS